MSKRPRRKPGQPEGEALVTIHDGARAAKVSIATVSRALNAEQLVRHGGRAWPGHHVGEHEGGRRGREAPGRAPLVHVSGATRERIDFAVTKLRYVPHSDARCALKERGLRVPEDISLTGFDDLPTIQDLSPPHSSVRTPISALGGRAAGRLLARIEAAETAEAPKAIAPGQQVLAVLLAVLASTGVPVDEPGPAIPLRLDQFASRAPPGM